MKVPTSPRSFALGCAGWGRSSARPRALGLKPWHVMRLVVLPQAFRIIIPPIGNQFISMLKLMALVEVIGVQELLLVASQAASSNFRYLEALSAAGIYYLLLTTVFMAVQARIEQALGRDDITDRVKPFNRLSAQARWRSRRLGLRALEQALLKQAGD